jgi:hypothetical protein
MELQAISQSPHLRDAATTAPKNILLEKASCLSEKFDMDEVMVEIFTILAQNEEKAEELFEKIALREQKFREELTRQMQNESTSIHKTQKAQNFFPLAMVGEGVATMALTGPNPLSVACIAIGGGLALDVLLDDAGKKAVAGSLSKLSGESKGQWLERIAVATGLATLGLSFFTTGSQAVQIVSSLSQVALSCGKTGSQFYLGRQRASLEEHSTEWEISGIKLQSWLGNLTVQQDTMAHHYEILQAWSDSSQKTIETIFA